MTNLNKDIFSKDVDFTSAEIELLESKGFRSYSDKSFVSWDSSCKDFNVQKYQNLSGDVVYRLDVYERKLGERNFKHVESNDFKHLESVLMPVWNHVKIVENAA